MQFYNFGNDETFHFFQWVVHSGLVSSDDLIKQAYDQVEKNDWYERGMDISNLAHDELTKILDALLDKLADDWVESIGVSLALPDSNVDDMAESEDYGSVDALFMPFIVKFVRSVCPSTVAKALLIRARKWAPDRDRPKLI